MALEVPQHIYQRLVAVIDDLRNAVGQEAAKAFLASLIDFEPVELYPQTEECDDSWMDYMNDATSPSHPARSSPFVKTEDASLRTTGSQTEADTCCPAPSPHTANPMSQRRSATPGPCERCWESEACQKRGRSEYNMLEAVAQGLPRSATHWQALTMGGIYAMPSHQVLTWTLEGSSEQARRLQHHLILRHLDVEDDLHQWRRSIAERRNLDRYNAFYTEAQAKRRTEGHTLRSGERSSSIAHKEYLAHIFSDRNPKDYKRAKQSLQKDLRHRRR